MKSTVKETSPKNWGYLNPFDMQESAMVWRGAPKLQILAERRRERRFPTVVEYRF
jgi:hypothetical protein